MEIFPAKFCSSVRAKWGRKYERLDGGQRRSVRRGKLGGGSYRRVKVRKVLWKLSPGRIMRRVKDAYIGAMLGLVGKGGGLSGFTAPEGFWSKPVPGGRTSKPAVVDFDTRILIEIYKSLLTPRELAAL